MNPIVYVLLPVHNRREVTRNFVECLVQQSYTSWQLILIDDGSTDGTASMVTTQISNAVVLTGRGDWWWAGSVAAGLDWLHNRKTNPDDIVLIANDDIEFDRDFLADGIKILRESPRTLLSFWCYGKQTGKLLDRGTTINWKIFSFKISQPSDVISCLSTKGLLGTVTEVLSVGPLKPLFLKQYLADCEFTIRAAKRGLKLVCSPVPAIRVDEETTGYHYYSSRSVSQLIKILFSPKCSQNPIAWFFFICFACPWQWKLKGIAMVLWKAFHQLRSRQL